MEIRKRWPILFAACSGLAYLANNYSISGVEHLRLEPRPSTPTYTSGGTNGVYDSIRQQNLLSQSDLYSRIPSAVRQGSVFDNLPPWENKLGVGEKLAIVQEQLSQKIQNLAPTKTVHSPLSMSLPLPIEMGNASAPPAAAMNPKANTIPRGNMTGIGIFDRVSQIRIASFNLAGLGPNKLAKAHVSEALVSLLSMFEVVAIQGIQSDRDDILPILIERMNQSGRNFDYLIGPRLGPAGQTSLQLAFIFDTARIETDRFQMYTLEDPEQLMTYDPLVGWFRCRDTPADQAFTFTLVNVHMVREASAELQLVPNIFHAVSSDGRNEDDLILVGDFGGNPATVAQLNNDSIRLAIRDGSTEVSGNQLTACILFPSKGTTEFTGKSGVVDFVRKYNLSLERAVEISTQMPVWAEFYVNEGAYPGRVAPGRPDSVFQ